MSDINEVKLSGSIGRLKAIHTKSGKPMAEFSLRCGTGQFRIVAFGNVASHILGWGKDGDQITVTGKLNAERWQRWDGAWDYSVSVMAWGIELHGEKVSYQRGWRASQPPWPRQSRREDNIPTPPPGAYF